MVMVVLKIVTVFLDVVMASVIAYFVRPLHWSDPDDRSSIVGFSGMIMAYMLSALLLLLS